MKADLEKKPVELCRDEDRLAYTDLVRMHSSRIFAICLGMLGNRHDAEDLAQQTMLKGLTDIKQLKDKGLFGQWISRIAKNLCVDFIRRQKCGENILAEHCNEDISSTQDYYELESALEKLPEDCRLILLLYYFDGKSTQTIGETLDLNQSAVHARMSRARKELRKLLAAEGCL